MFSKVEIKQRLSGLRAQGHEIKADYNLACFIVSAALIEQVDKAGRPYMRHVNAVALNNPDATEEERIIGTLHDLVEDTRDMPEDCQWTFQDLLDVGFSQRIVDGVDAVTKRENEKYFDFIVRCSQNPEGLHVKLDDLANNMSKARNNYLPLPEDVERDKKYILSNNYLLAVKAGEIAPGTRFGTWLAQASSEMQGRGGWEIFDKYSSEGRPSSIAPVFRGLQP
jgi:(p)ppGpp synthase/HD superfamily hydrolase